MGILESEIPEKTSILLAMEELELREEILSHLQENGFIVDRDKLIFNQNDKEQIRNLHSSAVKYMRSRYKDRLIKKELKLIKFVANGKEIIPTKIHPEMVLVDSKHELWELFNYIKIHWSIPISDGYGKRLYYIIFDGYNNKVIGILGLCDPVFSIKTRDNYIGWSKKQRNNTLNRVMDAFVIGAIPPYSSILGGKLIASLLFTNKIRKDFREKYEGKTTLISKRKNTGDLVLITTLSAFGKSSIYDRINLPGGPRFISTGYSKGYGIFHFQGKIYDKMRLFVSENDLHRCKLKSWGSGFRNRREVILKAFKLLNIPKSYEKHGIRREQFIVPLAENFKDVLLNNEKPKYYNFNLEDITEFMKNRWVIPRSMRDEKYKKWKQIDYLLWH